MIYAVWTTSRSLNLQPFCSLSRTYDIELHTETLQCKGYECSNFMMVVNIQDFLSGNVVQVGCSNNSRGLNSKISQDARLLDNIAGHISTNQSRRAEIKHHSSCRIEKKGDRDSRRREKSLDIGIFDEETENRMLTRQPEHYSHRTRFRTSLKHRRVSTA